MAERCYMCGGSGQIPVDSKGNTNVCGVCNGSGQR